MNGDRAAGAFQIVLSVDAFGPDPDRYDIAQFGAVLTDSQFTEKLSVNAGYCRPDRLEFDEAHMSAFGIRSAEQVTSRMAFWQRFPAAWAEFTAWAVRKTGLRSFEEVLETVPVCGWAPHTDLSLLEQACFRAGVDHPLRLWRVGEVHSLSSSIAEYERHMAQLGLVERVGSTLEEVAESFGFRLKNLDDPVARCEGVRNAFRAFADGKKSTYEHAYAVIASNARQSPRGPRPARR